MFCTVLPIHADAREQCGLHSSAFLCCCAQMCQFCVPIRTIDWRIMGPWIRTSRNQSEPQTVDGVMPHTLSHRASASASVFKSVSAAVGLQAAWIIFGGQHVVKLTLPQPEPQSGLRSPRPELPCDSPPFNPTLLQFIGLYTHLVPQSAPNHFAPLTISPQLKVDPRIRTIANPSACGVHFVVGTLLHWFLGVGVDPLLLRQLSRTVLCELLSIDFQPADLLP